MAAVRNRTVKVEEQDSRKIVAGRCMSESAD
ncbi:hypothetical protein ERE07_04145 [Allopusillimonas ginsengisoli]|nr:hypothetical protein ERE07_04145 [Allopusillimonas ginsengisoli]